MPDLNINILAMKHVNVNILLSIIIPFLVYLIFKLQWPSWNVVIIAGFLISILIDVRKILEFAKTSILSIVIFSAVFGMLVQILRPDNEATFLGVFTVYFIGSVIFSLVGQLAGFFSKSLVLKMFNKL